MSYEIIPFAPAHVSAMRLQKQQVRLLSHIAGLYLEALADPKSGTAATAVVDGRVIACAGIAVQGFGVGTLWGFIAQDAGPYFVRLDRGVRRMMTLIPLRRLEASCETDFAAGCRWLEMLGFEQEGILHRYGPDGADHHRYAWLAQTRTHAVVGTEAASG